jgi:predicted amidophosphoribosyltransferase
MSSLPDTMYDCRPQREEPKQITICSCCGWGIYSGEDYWEIDNKNYCADCMNEFKKVGGEE